MAVIKSVEFSQNFTSDFIQIRFHCYVTVDMKIPKMLLEKYTKPQSFLNQTENELMDLIIMDPGSSLSNDEVKNLILLTKQRTKSLMIVSNFASETENRRLLSQWGVTEFLAKPCHDFDFEHALNLQRIIHYRERELKRVEEAADTDRLTGLANRRRLDDFVEALVTL